MKRMWQILAAGVALLAMQPLVAADDSGLTKPNVPRIAGEAPRDDPDSDETDPPAPPPPPEDCPPPNEGDGDG